MYPMTTFWSCPPFHTHGSLNSKMSTVQALLCIRQRYQRSTAASCCLSTTRFWVTKGLALLSLLIDQNNQRAPQPSQFCCYIHCFPDPPSSSSAISKLHYFRRIPTAKVQTVDWSLQEKSTQSDRMPQRLDVALLAYLFHLKMAMS